MTLVESFNLCLIIFLLFGQIAGLSFNLPKFCSSATWNPMGITFASSSITGPTPYSVFVDASNTVYVGETSQNQVQVWPGGNTNPTRTISDGLNQTKCVFVTSNGDIYVDNGNNGRVVKWTLNASTSVPVLIVTETCYGLFVDINNTLYCSNGLNVHQVIKRSLNDNLTTTTLAAGTGLPGSTSDMLDNARGIFVDINFDLYVADGNNNRIQLFQLGEQNGTTVAGSGAQGTITLNFPTAVILDADRYLFIVDFFNFRIVASGPNGFRCVAGCSNSSGSLANQFYYPWSLSFDSYGNIYVADRNNNRIQKFLLATNSCDQTTTNSIQQSTKPLETTVIQSTIHIAVEESSTSTSIVPMSTMKMTITNQSCSLPLITLIPGTSSLASPIQFRRNQDFFISSNIRLNCNISLATITKWTINNCSTNCSNQIQNDQTIITTFSELFIPARTLVYGTYELKLTVKMTVLPNLISSASAYVKITPSGITANLIQFGTSMITRGCQQNLTLDPGTYSVDLDGNIFNASDWKYEYYCRIYGLYNFPNIGGILIPIDDPTIDPLNPSCIKNITSLQYSGNIKSSITILSGSLSFNQTYQFMVYMENRRNATLQATGYLLVLVDNNQPQMIILACVISTMCIPNQEYQLVNPTTQVALFSICSDSLCSKSIQNITWNIYQGFQNGSSTIIQWIKFNQLITYENIWFFGTNTSNFTAINKLFLDNPSVLYWRFEVVYSFITEISSSSLNFVINQSPINGSCTIKPLNGTTSTLFTISCPNWVDEDGIKDYSVYGYTEDISSQTMIAFSFVSDFQVRLPAGDDNTSLLNIIIQIRDTLDCITELNMTRVTVTTDIESISQLINNFQTSSNQLINNPIIQLLASGNQNTVGQIITSISKQFNKFNNENLEKAVSNGIPATTISISSLGYQSLSNKSILLNKSALIQFNIQLNSYANIRDYLITFINNLIITTSTSILLQASSLVQLTQATNQLTRQTSIIASEKCYQLARILYSLSTTIPYEDVQTAANQITQCTTNILTAINGPLQQRTNILDLDSSRANTFPDDYDTDLESEWANPNLFSNGNDFSWESIQKGRNLYYQKQTATQITIQITETISLLTSALNIHLNIGQNSLINTSSVFMSLERTSIELISNKFVQQIGGAHIHLPEYFNLNINKNQTASSVSLRSMMQPLASADQYQTNTNLSTSISFSIMDLNGNDVSIQTNINHSMIELIIPRDSNLVISSMILQNITMKSLHYQLFNLHYVNITQTNNLTISIHFEMHPLNITLAYLLIYRFDNLPQYNNSRNQIDGWFIFCPSNLTNDNLYTYFIDNQRTNGHQSIIFGLRELNSTEINKFCSNLSSINNPPIIDQPFNFTENYELRIYTSGCYYLDKNNNWKSDGLLVGSLTNHYQTQCYSTHLTTFSSGFRVLSEPINWNYIFTNNNYNENKTIYLIVIFYILLIICARFKDKRDIEKVKIVRNVLSYKSTYI